MSKSEEFMFKQLADMYVDDAGKRLQEELARMQIHLDTRSLDAKVYEGIKSANHTARKRRLRNFSRVCIPIAASFLIIISAVFFFQLRRPSGTYEESMESPATEESMQGELIPLSHPLPSNLSVVDSELDNGMTIYRLQDLYNDDVVMQMIREEDGEFSTEDMIEIEVNGQIVYGRTTDSYHIITFKSDGIIYTLTCAFDINTLLSISENIL